LSQKDQFFAIFLHKYCKSYNIGHPGWSIASTRSSFFKAFSIFKEKLQQKKTVFKV
jgi:hypothetical protein